MVAGVRLLLESYSVVLLLALVSPFIFFSDEMILEILEMYFSLTLSDVTSTEWERKHS